MVVKANRGKKTKRAQEFFVSSENLSGLGQLRKTFTQRVSQSPFGFATYFEWLVH